MKNILTPLFAFGLLLALITSPGWTASKPLPTKAKPATHTATKPSVPVDPIKVLEAYMLPKTAEGNIAAWGDGSNLPIHWNTQNLVGVDDISNAYAFFKKGTIPNWTVNILGPRAGVARVQLTSPKPFDLRAALNQHHIPYEVRGCMPTGPLLYLTAPGKQPSMLYSKGDNELHFWPSLEFTRPEDLKMVGIQTVSPPNYCRY